MLEQVLLSELDKFWSNFKVGSGWRDRTRSTLREQETIDILAFYAREGGEICDPETSRYYREEFENSPHRYPVREKCFVCGARPNLRHHVIPLGRGGTNILSNLVSLCEPCHNKIHPHLATMTTAPIVSKPERITVHATNAQNVERNRETSIGIMALVCGLGSLFVCVWAPPLALFAGPPGLVLVFVAWKVLFSRK